MPTITAEIIINGKPEKVREHFLKLENHSNWNPFFTKVSMYKKKDATATEVQPGDRLEIEMKPEGWSSLTMMYPRVLANTVTEFVWKGDLIFSWIFSGTHSFVFMPQANDEGKIAYTRLVQSETFSGVLVPLLTWMGLFSLTEKSFHALNEALKEQVEQLE